MKTLIHIDDVETALYSVIEDSEKANKVMEFLDKLLKDEDEAKEKKPRTKYETVIVSINDADNDIDERSNFVVKIEEGKDHNDIIDQIKSVAAKHNSVANSKKKVTSVCSALSNIPKSKFKEFEGINVVTREPVIVVKGSNSLES